MQTTRNSSVANAAPSRNIHIFFIVHSPLMAFMPFCLSIITILLDSLLVLPYKKGCFDYFRFSLQVAAQKTAPASCYGNRGGSFALFVLFQALTQSLAGVLDSSLSSSQTCDRHTEGRAADIVQTDVVAELHARGVAAVLAAYAQTQIGACLLYTSPSPRDPM